MRCWPGCEVRPMPGLGPDTVVVPVAGRCEMEG